MTSLPEVNATAGPPIVPVILSGGSGTRLWPLSRRSRPKQLTALHTDRTMLQETVTRLEGLPGLQPPVIVANGAHADLILAQLAEVGVEPEALILEPVGRNTAPAIAAAALAVGSDDDAVLVVLPSDHLIEDTAAFRTAVAAAARLAADGSLVTFGIVPDHPETGYGYIEAGDPIGSGTAGAATVARFVEKPDLTTATGYVDSGRYLWNSGMFAFRCSTFLTELGRFESEIATVAAAALRGGSTTGPATTLGPEFAASPGISVDYAVMERTDSAVVIPLDVGWSDLGSWAALWEVGSQDDDGNVTEGDVVTIAVQNSLVRSSGRVVAVVGLDDVVVVDTPDALLVCSRDQAQDVKQIVDRLAAEGRSEVER